MTKGMETMSAALHSTPADAPVAAMPDPEVPTERMAADKAQSLSGAHSDLSRAAHNGDHTRLLHLLKRGANVNAAQMPKRLTALHYAASMGHLACGRLLVEHGANVNAFARDMSTPLHLSAARGRHGAKPGLQTSLGFTAKDMADIGGHVTSAQLLAEALPTTMAASQLSASKLASHGTPELPPILTKTHLVAHTAGVDPKAARRALRCRQWLQELSQCGLFQQSSDTTTCAREKENILLSPLKHSLLSPNCSLGLVRIHRKSGEDVYLKSSSQSTLVAGPRRNQCLPPLRQGEVTSSRSLADLQGLGGHAITQQPSFPPQRTGEPSSPSNNQPSSSKH